MTGFFQRDAERQEDDAEELAWFRRQWIPSAPEIRFILSKLGHGDFSSIRPDPSFTGQDALALAERLKERLKIVSEGA